VIFRLPKRPEELTQELPFRTFLISPNLVSQNVEQCYRDITPTNTGVRLASTFSELVHRRRQLARGLWLNRVECLHSSPQVSSDVAV
jgi:hypothetical protein